ncbi:putative reverse transcriptase zinc-binding domain-containing protein [Arabidopsis thaliana]|uniref:RNA-directed DNA polymerase (Reverse transcriptase)-related family protein n=3 Tax=Arabidopsis TaxID=3701 RepID=F4JDR1_ARATH|nr:RNA-directed DNA polymerase (reverse transcriptase)-related family protein [Arabidopsis thaliana]AEE77224.1 RNA-directed DNA polymerase (reverse transcriptase)-related family protein [Arabidopsis thaliana]KAG7626719.1 Reverse transcriptase zinc-binding domain [Arabidopsis thaliana x Arabidopsis arenosa]KAG7632695.1 Reverse transcriptase zinc-binding domain [Arabidopsis suecica]|eukprot:NP_683598.1 RNA-directed DNA polymerase (reverse transcriptase)-related family protein [Arabidopsis thaliana]
MTNNWIGDIWSLKISPKIKLLIWKALNNALPVGAQLLSRNISIEPFCTRCRDFETITHILFNCPFAQREVIMKSIIDAKEWQTAQQMGSMLGSTPSLFPRIHDERTPCNPICLSCNPMLLSTFPSIVRAWDGKSSPKLRDHTPNTLLLAIMCYLRYLSLTTGS